MILSRAKLDGALEDGVPLGMRQATQVTCVALLAGVGCCAQCILTTCRKTLCSGSKDVRRSLQSRSALLPWPPAKHIRPTGRCRQTPHASGLAHARRPLPACCRRAGQRPASAPCYACTRRRSVLVARQAGAYFKCCICLPARACAANEALETSSGCTLSPAALASAHCMHVVASSRAFLAGWVTLRSRLLQPRGLLQQAVLTEVGRGRCILHGGAMMTCWPGDVRAIFVGCVL